MTYRAELIQLAARAIVADLARQDDVEGTWNLEDGKLAFLDQGEVDMVQVATAALDAILEKLNDPSEEMLKEGARVHGFALTSSGSILRAMLSAINPKATGI